MAAAGVWPKSVSKPFERESCVLVRVTSGLWRVKWYWWSGCVLGCASGARAFGQKVGTEPAGLASTTSLGEPAGRGRGGRGGLHGAAH